MDQFVTDPIPNTPTIPIPNTPTIPIPNPTPELTTNTNPEVTLNTPPIDLKSPKKEGDDKHKRKPVRTSDIWAHFTKVTGGNSERYKILSMIAKDVLAIQVSTVASESAFSTSGRILDPFRSSLSPEMVEALVCTQSWLKGQQGGLKLDNYVDDSHSYQFLEEKEHEHGKESETMARNVNIIEV